MKKLFTLFAAALVMLAAVSCEKNEVLPGGNVEGKVITLKASINNGETKTSLGAGVAVPESDPVQYTYPVLWSEGDAIAVIQTNGVGQGQAARIFKFVLKEGDGGKTSGEFELEISDNCGYTAGDFNASEEIIAFYPFEDVCYSGINEDNQFKISYNIPDVQVYAKNTFEKGASPMVAYRATDANGTLSFQNLFGVLKLQLQGANEKVQSIEIISSTHIAGNETGLTTPNKASLQFDYRFGSLDGRKRVTLDCGNDGVSINNLTTFMIALHPDATDLEVFIHTDKASYYKTIPTLDVNENPINDITAGNILAMGGLNTADMSPAYIDEQGIYQGDGIAVSGVIWAPVNCGYDDEHKYGLLYQWGRKDGQDYSINSEYITTLGDNTSPEYNIFYTDWNPTYTVWSDENSPCPTGWRVPTIGELSSGNSVPDEGSYNGINGFWFADNIFFPAAGYLQNNGTANGRNREISYWSSNNSNGTEYIKIGGGVVKFVDCTTANPACGFSVRCVKDTPQSEPISSGN